MWRFLKPGLLPFHIRFRITAWFCPEKQAEGMGAQAPTLAPAPFCLCHHGVPDLAKQVTAAICSDP